MAGLEDSLFSFFAGSPSGAPTSYPAMEARRKIALAVMANSGRKGFPKTLGEGLTAIGDAIGERGVMNQLTAQEAAYAKQAAAAVSAAMPEGAPAAPAPAPAASTRTSYAPPGDTAETPPATAAPAAAVPATGGGWNEGNWGKENFMDAQANMGLKPNMPGYLQDAITSREPNPEMQAYFGSLSASEAPKGARDVSPTGAAGPFQFTRGTGVQYGIPGAARMDPGASTDAVRQLTADNAAAFQRINGRPPSYADLALMHQQGGTTGARMAAGTGNAPPGNLAVNNISPGASAAGAAAQIGKFYGMPNTPAQVSSRDMIAAQLAARQAPAAGGPQPNPTLAGPVPFNSGAPPGGDAMAFAGLPPEIAQGASQPLPRPAQPPTPALAQGIQPAPPAAPPIVMPPETRYPPPAPAPAEPRPSVQAPVPPQLPPLEPKSDQQVRNERALLQAQSMGDPQLTQLFGTAVANAEKERQANYARRVQQYTAEQASYEAAKARYETYQQGTPQRELELQKLEDERQQRVKAEALAKQLGQIPQETYINNLNKSKETVAGIPAAMQSVKRARDLVDNNKAFFGSASDFDTSLAKLAGAAGFPVNPKASGTEQFKTAMGDIMALSRKAIVGAGAQSEAELQLLKQTAAADTKLEPATIQASLKAAEHLMLTSAMQHQQAVRRFAGEEDPQRQAQVYGQWAIPGESMVDMVTKADVGRLMQHAGDPNAQRDFDNTYHTPGLALSVLRRYRGGGQ